MMRKRKKEKSGKYIVKLGKIVDDKMTGFSSNLIWNLDATLAIIIRDSLRYFAENVHSYPTPPDFFECTREKDEQWYKDWVDKVNQVADKFDTYVRDDDDFLTDEERKRQYDYYAHGKGSIADIRAKSFDINQMKINAVKEGCEMLKEIFPSLWD